ncbi:MAG TPA: SRPBCC domain-containing protein [Solirubrobacteraceae bacterium]|nr:SRPBCC domain-containing protein [Solirubrobacteraceae bacterium]
MPDSATQNDRQVAIVRTFDAPPEQVWQAWADPAQVALWWGPHGFETPVDSVVIELRPGGRYDFTMVDTRSGASFPVRQEVLEVSAAELLVLRHEPMPEHGLLEPIDSRIEFQAHDGGTRVEITSGPYTADMGPNAEQGWSEQLEKLARMLSA